MVMVIELHGFPGSGKTTALAMIAQRALKGKSTLGLMPTDKVLTSFPCPGCYRLDWGQLGKTALSDCLVIIDEISLYADNRDFKNFGFEKLQFFKLHRHGGIDVVWCSQSASDADKKIRAVTEVSYIIDALPLGFSAIKPIQKMHGIKNGEPGELFRLAPPLMWYIFWRPRWYSYFDSYQMPELPPPELELWDMLPVKGVPVRRTPTGTPEKE